ncbi:MAG: ATP-dependent zinc protease [Gammaproteobacteria bacterium]
MKREKILVGWREWISLPLLGIPLIKTKIDTGARTSALHAFRVEYSEKQVNFDLHPIQHQTTSIISCVADVIDYRWVMDSGGHREQRYVIKTRLILDNRAWPIEITLTNRDDMRFRMLLGRTAIRKRLIVDPSASFLLGHSS